MEVFYSYRDDDDGKKKATYKYGQMYTIVSNAFHSINSLRVFLFRCVHTAIVWFYLLTHICIKILM